MHGLEMYEYDRHEFGTGNAFEEYCAGLLVRNVYQNVCLTPHNDRGVDITAWKEGVLYAFQCKLRNAGSVSRRAVQEIYTGMHLYGASEGVIMTNAELSKGAWRDADLLGIKVWGEYYLRLLSDK